ncbi:protease pro-enzyme activation domain-containing protein [Scleromatobacter humisilvae]|uniref:S53 family peptidase n=1 Tax=Scleromatobacter humisilvae TaxID=2897159 RepID=A0A9X1YG24_9BURK|nr:protease pro-enzyme activation domain-containing protein [Scleromatobacter humisilvae]MCK9685032.1 S53 family peptidase [Scleromatobacter humisilvae]
MSTQAIPAHYQRVAGTLRNPAAAATRQGPADAGETVQVTISLRRRVDGPPAPDFDAVASMPLNARKPMSQDEFAAKYGAHPADIAKVEDFVQTAGMKVVETNAARRTVVAAGTVAQMNRAFAVDLGRYTAPAPARTRNEQPRMETYRGRDGYVHVPAALADIVVGVFGLDNRTIIKRNSADPANTHTLTIPTLKQLYNFPTNSAQGQTIGIVSMSGYAIHDVQLLFNGLGAGYTMPAVHDVPVHGSNSGSDPFGETTQDIGIAAAAANGAAIAVYITQGSQAGWVDMIHRVAHPNAGDPSCSVLSSSWYLSNGDDAATLAAEGITTAFINAVSAAFQDAAIQGITVCIACGDTGSNSKMNNGAAHVQYPGSDPWVLSVGGTTVGNVAGSSFEEYVWNDPSPTDPSHWGTTGGGVSDFFALPSYQVDARVPASVNAGHHVGRGLPDVSANASYHAGYAGLYLNGQPMIGNGTSASAPLWAGFVATLNAAMGTRLGFINPILYSKGSNAFRDIVPGAGPANNANGGVAGYPAGPGWDACTGWGSIDGAKMLNMLRGVGQPPGLAVFNSRLFMAWKGIEHDQRIWFSNFNGASWAPQQFVAGVATSCGPSLAMHNGTLFMAWKGMNADEGIWYSSYNGSTWAPQKNVPGIATSTGPALAVFNGKLYMAWKGMVSDQAIWWSSFNGTSWAPQQFIPGVATSVGPQLAEFQGSLYAIWKGMNQDQGLWYSHFNGTAWAAQKQVPGVGTSEGASIAVFNNRLHACWKGMNDDQRIWTSSFDGTSWTAQQLIPGIGTSVGPALTVFNGRLTMTWKGITGDDRVFYSSFNGKTWSPQAQIVGIGTNPFDIREPESALTA